MNNTSNSFEHSELISAYLDGEVTEEERAFVENNPDLLVEVKKLKKIQEITSSTVPIDPILQEKHLTKALSALPKGGKIVPFRQKKIIQRGGLLAVAAAAAAFILIPVINSQTNKSTDESDLATSFVESSTSTTKSTQNDSTEEPDETSVVPELDEGAGIAEEAPRNTQAGESSNSKANTTSTSDSFTAEEETEVSDEEETEALEEEETEVSDEAGEPTAEQLTTAETMSSRVFEEEPETIDSLLETANNIWEINRETLSSPLTPIQIENFFNENTEFRTCWINEPFFDTSTRTPLLLQHIMLNGRPSLVLISEDLQSELIPLISVYQVDTSCSLFFEAPIFEEIPSE